MQKMIVQDKNNNKLFVGTKQDCMHYAKRHCLQQGEYSVKVYTIDAATPPIYTTAPTESKPKGFFKKIFGS